MIDFSKLGKPMTEAERARDEADRQAALHAADRKRRDAWAKTAATLTVVEVGQRRVTSGGDTVWTIYGTIAGKPAIRRLEWFAYPWEEPEAADVVMDSLQPGDQLKARGYVNKDGKTFQAQYIEKA